MRFYSASGSVRVTTGKSGVAVLAARGVTTQAEVAAVLEAAWALRCRRHDNYLALVIDVRRAIVLDFEGGAVIYPESPGIPTLMKTIPTAMVVPQYMVPNARRYSMHCAMEGAVVGGFTEFRAGVEWALERGEALRRSRQVPRQRKSLVRPLHTPSGAERRR